MNRRALIPDGTQAAVNDLKISPGILSHGHVFVTGMTGSRPDGSMPENIQEQFHLAFQKIGLVLSEGGLDFSAVVEMTSYHVGLRAHFETFRNVRSEYVREPYPTWTAIEVAGLRREGAVVEIRVVAATANS